MFGFRSLITTCKRADINLIRHISSQERSYKEVAIKVPWGYIAGKWWGPYDRRPVLSLHGWQDNCATFDRLVPYLNKDVGFLTIDLPGHGYSSRLPPGMYYYITNYVVLIKYIASYFQWPKVSLMGHSLGGISSYVYSMIYPENVDFVVCLDGAKPMITPNSYDHLGKTITSFLKYSEQSSSSTEPPSYPLEEMKRKIVETNKNSIKYEYSEILLERNMAPSRLYPGQYYFTRDPRIKAGSALIKFEQSEILRLAQFMAMPICIIKAREASYYEPKENFYEVLDVLKRSSVDCDFHYVKGTHHAHLNDPEEVGPLISKFIQRHNVEDRSVGGINDDIIVEDKKSILAKL